MQVKEDTIISRFQNGDRRIILWFSLFLQNVTELLDTLLLQKLYFLTPHTHVENPSSATGRTASNLGASEFENK